MKKQSKPIGLIVVLGLFVLAAAGINGFQNGMFKLPESKKSETSESRPTESTTKTVAADVSSKLSGITKSAPPKNAQAEMMLKNRNGRPLMALDTAQNAPVTQPKPNDASTATHWYKDQARPD